MTPVDRIHALGRFSGAPGLHRIRALCAALGNPQDRLQFVHLAGTNGKGSTATMIAQVMQQAGYRVGLFTSPFLVTFHERIRVNGQMIADDTLTRLFDRVMAVVRTLSFPEGEHIGEFEFVTALAFLHFLEQKCDLVVLEAGLGGSFDATNVIAPPEAAIITSVSLDHIAILGDTAAQIAQTKAGIYKPSSAHISAPCQSPEVLHVLLEAAPDLMVAPLAEICEITPTGSIIRWQGETYTLSLPGYYQVQNASTSLFALQMLRARGWRIPQHTVQEGLRLAHIPGRMQQIRTNPTIILDGAHNPDGMRSLSESVKSFHFSGCVHLIIGMCADKAVLDTVNSLSFPCDAVYVTPLQQERSLDPDTLCALLAPISPHRTCCTDCADALSRAQAQAAPEDVILVCGSLYLVGEAKKILGA